MRHTIAAGEFKAKCLQLMEQVRLEHRAIVITKRGKPIAKLIPFEEQTLGKKKSLFGYMQGTVTILGDIVSPIDEVWDAEKDDA